MRHEQLSVNKLTLSNIEKIVDGNGVKSADTVTAVDEAGNVIHKTTLTIEALPITVADDAGVAQYGGAKIYDFPLGLIGILGCVVDGDLTGYASLIDTFDGDVSIGTVTATTGATLAGTEADIMQSNALTQAVAEVAAVAAGSTGMTVINGLAGAKDAYLNFVVDDNVAHGAGTAHFTGKVVINWVNLGTLS
jgi:hypothetical protein